MKQNLIRKVGLLLLAFTFLFNTIHTTPAYAVNAPTLLYPAHLSTKTAVDTPPLGVPAFKWSAVAGTTVYRIQISNNPAFTLNVVDMPTFYQSYTPVNVLNFPDGTWYWHVRAEQPVASPYSATWQYVKKWATPGNAPTLTAPADGVTLNFYDNQTFSWTRVIGASRYLIQLYAQKDNWSTPFQQDYTVSPSYQPQLKLANGASYWWRVVPVDAQGHLGTPSPQYTFTANYDFAPTLLEPANLTTPTFTPTFRWEAVRGAEYYTLQYSTLSNFASDVATYFPRSTSFTPLVALPNDKNYYWRVRAHSGYSVSSWSTVWQFVKRWYIKPQLLTPTNLYLNVRFPLFSWTPVPGASYYKVELDDDSNFAPPIFDTVYTANTFSSPTNYAYSGLTTTFYWRVTPYDGNSQAGVTSDNGQFDSYKASVAPHLVYPFYYYTPDNYPGFAGVTTNPHEDHTVPLPIFIWNRLLKPSGDVDEGNVYPGAYRLQVDDDEFFGSIDWQVDTENTSAAPTVSNPFTPNPATIYYWRVAPLAAIGGATNGPWSQKWKTRIDLTKGLTPKAAGSAPFLIRPTNGFEFAESTPLLEWFPITGATSYDVQISQDQNFGSIADSGTVSYPAYIPTASLAQRSLGDVDFGVYWWRVRQSPSGTWSSIRRYQISAQSQWKANRAAGAAGNQLQIGSDPSGDVGNANYDLTDLQAAQTNGFWYIGFHVPSVPSQNVTYGLYLDIDHGTAVSGTGGGTFDPYVPAYNVSTITGYRPEYVLYIPQVSGVFDASTVRMYKWAGSSWATVGQGDLAGNGGSLNKTGNYVELKIPVGAIGSQDTTGTYAASLFSLAAGGGSLPQDSVPSDPDVPGTGVGSRVISRFANVTERMNLVAPPNNAGTDPTAYPSVTPFFWDWPILVPYLGASMSAYKDDTFTTLSDSYILSANNTFNARTAHAWPKDLTGDNTYYWRIQPAYTGFAGAWSQGWRVERKGFVPQNPQTTVAYTVPTFKWDMVEGAHSYDLMVDNDNNFGSPEISITTMQTSYTVYYETLPPGNYYWKVRVNRNGLGSLISNSWTANQPVTLALPAPTGLLPAGNPTVYYPPTLCWNPKILMSTEPVPSPVEAAWKYTVQVSKDSGFSIIYDVSNNLVNDQRTEQSCWTPTKGYDDGPYYWRVAMIDGSGRQGVYSTTGRFTKGYPKPTLISPINHSSGTGAPTFTWSAVPGAGYYKLEVSQSPDFSPVITAYTQNTSYTPTDVVYTTSTAPVKFYWRVAMVDIDNGVGPFNSADVFLTRPTTTVTLASYPIQDGFVLESAENSNAGGSFNNAQTTFFVGDHATKKQYRSILSFTTGANIPDNAVISAVTLKVKKQGIFGGNANIVSAFQGFMIDVKNGFFGPTASLENADFGTAPTKIIGPIPAPSLVNNVYSFNLMNAQDAINKLTTSSGLTQIRLRFKLDDNNDGVAQYLSLFSGNTTVAADRPQLVITYYIP